MIDLDISFDYREIERGLSAMERRELPKATMRAINKTAKQAHTVAVREVSKDIGLPQKDVRAKFALLKATRLRPLATIRATGRRLPLTRFKARQTRKGVAYRGRGGQRKTIPHAFVATMKTGHIGVFQRLGKKRLPIQEKFGPSIPYIFDRPHIRSRVLARAQQQWPKNFEHEVRYALQKAGFRT